MSQWLLYGLSGIGVVTIALHGVFTCQTLIRKIVAINLMGSGVFLVLVALARRSDAGIPDPVPHALVLTGIVVSVSATAFALALLWRLAQLDREASAEGTPPTERAPTEGGP